MGIHVSTIIIGVLGIFLYWLIPSQYVRLSEKEKYHYIQIGGLYSVRILRDKYGLTHIFGKTDPDVAYGLAYIHAEDNFITIQEQILAARGKLSYTYGIEKSESDYILHLLHVWDFVSGGFMKLEPRVRQSCRAYADGLNHYAALHSENIFPGFELPVSPMDVVACFVFRVPVFYGVDKALKHLINDGHPENITLPPEGLVGWKGPNTLAMAPQHSREGQTLLAVRTAFSPFETDWYEAHLHSDEGLDVVGATIPMFPFVLQGHTAHLGWSLALTQVHPHPALFNVFALNINPNNENEYFLDGKWENLKLTYAPIKLRFLDWLYWTFYVEVWWSVYGPVVRTSWGVYAVRWPGIGSIDHLASFYKMNKATSLKDFKSALNSYQSPVFHVVYADWQGNLFYLYQTLFPKRNSGYNWERVLPGNTTETLWQEYLEWEKLPKLENPKFGYISDCSDFKYLRNEFFRFSMDLTTENCVEKLKLLFKDNKLISKEDFFNFSFNFTNEATEGLPIWQMGSLFQEISWLTNGTLESKSITWISGVSSKPNKVKNVLLKEEDIIQHLEKEFVPGKEH